MSCKPVVKTICPALSMWLIALAVVWPSAAVAGPAEDLFAAAASGNALAVQALLAKGVDVNARESHGSTALMAASFNGHLYVVRVLLAKGANVNAKGSINGGTPLMQASQNGHLEVVQTLLAKGADIDARMSDGRTALMQASFTSHLDVVKALLASGANVDARNNNGVTAFDAAIAGGHPEVRAFLEQARLAAPVNAGACSTSLTVQLETFGEGVTIELRQGLPGNSSVFASQRSTGGTVYFSKLCAGSYFMAIGDGDTVSVTPVRRFDDNRQYQSRIVVQHGSGNVTRKSRNSL